MKRSDLKGVILAAGKATRMLPFSTKFPKPILPVCNRPLIEYQIEEMKNVGIFDIIIVVGHLGFEITRTLGDGSQLGVRLSYIDQRETRGIAHAVGQLEQHLTEPFLLFLGDIFFQSRRLEDMFTLMEQGANTVLAVRWERDLAAIRSNFGVILDDEGLVKRVVEKPRHPPNNIKGCGLYLFDPYIFDAIRRTPRTAARDEYELTESIQILIDDGMKVRTVDVISYDLNLTSPCDLLASNLTQLATLKKDSVIGEGCRIHEETRISNSVVGENVVIEQPLSIQSSLIFSDTLVSYTGQINNMILTADDVIDCRFAGKQTWPGRTS